MKNVVIAGYARSPFAFANKGELIKVRPDDLAAQVVKGLIEKTGARTEDIEDLIVGCAFPEGEQGLNVARLIGFIAELPIEVAGATVNRFCGSSMQAIHMAAGAIQMDAGEVFLCAGVESMTRVPLPGFNPLLNPALYEAYPEAYISMGETAERVATLYDVSRDDQEGFAVASHQKAAAAQANGKFNDEIVPITSKDGTIKKDGCIPARYDARSAIRTETGLRSGRNGDRRDLFPVNRRCRRGLGMHRGLCRKDGSEAAGKD